MADRIEHVIVLMMENRSFDHILGAIPGVDGVSPAHPLENADGLGPGAASYRQCPVAVRKLKPDPKHDFANVMRQIDGGGLGRMGGFAYDMALAYPSAGAASREQVMAYFPDRALPSTHELAHSFCVCDRWFSSVPGPTWTNRFFMHSGTSQGWVEMPHLPFHPNLHKYDQKTVYDRLNERGVSWKIYFGDIPHSLLLHNQRTRDNLANYHRMATFYQDTARAAGDASGFPAYVFIEPSYLPFGQNDQHPPHDILKGDDLIAGVYNAIRGSPALWESTLLVVTYDEHGGFADHVDPPGAVSPDGKNQEGCDFTRYGPRVPALLISPWVRRAPFRPGPGTVDHTSVLKYLTERHKLGPLGNRTASAASIGGAIETTPQGDGPEKVGMAPFELLGVAPELPPSPAAEEELNPNQAGLIDFTRRLELEMGAPPVEVGARALRAAESLQAESEVAKERVLDYLTRMTGRSP